MERERVSILVTGGAGYVGSHAVRALLRRGYRVVVLDNLERGHQAAAYAAATGTGATVVEVGPGQPLPERPVEAGVLLVAGNVADRALVSRLAAGQQIAAAMHFAAYAAAGESVQHPERYFANNTAATVGLLAGLLEAGVRRLVFSSTSAVYGQPETLPVPEDHPLRPENPYGESKVLVERMLPWFHRAHGLRSVSLRYFNACGADPDGGIGDDTRPATRLVPVALEVAIGKRPVLPLYGDDYPTPDGTCIRDYIHVTDLAEAHVAALRWLETPAGEGYRAFNVGTGRGYSNREVIAAIEAEIGRRLPVVLRPRRPGDPAAVYADSRRIQAELGWAPRYSDLPTMIRTAWRWRAAHPQGYPD